MSTGKDRASNSNSDQDTELRKGPWTLEEDSQLIHYIARHGEGRWNMLAKLAGLKRTGKSCRLRWLNYLKPDIKRGNLSPQEQLLILELHSKWGNRWSKIAQHLPGRTDNEIKNYWRTRVQKQARQLNIESGSKRFLDAVRCFWMPRLLQKMEQSSSDGSCSSVAMNPENPADFSMLTSCSVAPSLQPPLPPPIASVACQHNGNTSTGFSNLNVSWTDPINILQTPDVSEWSSSPWHATDISNAAAYNSSINNSCYVDCNSYDQSNDIVGLNFDPISTVETNDISQYGYHIADSDWVLDDMADALWNMDAM